MLEDVLDVQSWNEPGYRSLVFSDGWRAAMLNDVSRCIICVHFLCKQAK